MRAPGKRTRGATLVAVLAAILAAAPRAPGMGSVSTVAPRPMAMGGAFLAVQDGAASMAWNPAGLLVPLCGRASRLALHANVLGAPAVVRETGLLTGVESDEFRSLPRVERAFVALGSLVKAAAFRRGAFCAGALLLEEGLDPETLAESRGLADARDLLDDYYSSAAVSFGLAGSVSIGISQTVYAGSSAAGGRSYGSGRAYGALLRPNEQVSVGLVYFDASPGFEDVRRGLEGLAPRTMNAGVTFAPFPSLLLSLDLRDLSERHGDTALRPRAGVEWVPTPAVVALRAGAYAEEESGEGVLTLGAGLIPMGCAGAGADAHVVDYAVLLAPGEVPRHLLSVLLRF